MANKPVANRALTSIVKRLVKSGIQDSYKKEVLIPAEGFYGEGYAFVFQEAYHRWHDKQLRLKSEIAKLYAAARSTYHTESTASDAEASLLAAMRQLPEASFATQYAFYLKFAKLYSFKKCKLPGKDEVGASMWELVILASRELQKVFEHRVQRTIKDLRGASY